MQINTKFSIGDEIWFIGEHHIRHGKINRFIADAALVKSDEKGEKECISTEVGYYVGSPGNSAYIMEECAFASKEELIKSL